MIFKARVVDDGLVFDSWAPHGTHLAGYSVTVGEDATLRQTRFDERRTGFLVRLLPNGEAEWTRTWPPDNYAEYLSEGAPDRREMSVRPWDGLSPEDRVDIVHTIWEGLSGR